MNCCITELGSKDVINTSTAMKLGTVCDLKIDCDTGKIIAIIVSAKNNILSLGKGEEILVPWENVQLIGEDSILVRCDNIVHEQPKKKGILDILK